MALHDDHVEFVRRHVDTTRLGHLPVLGHGDVEPTIRIESRDEFFEIKWINPWKYQDWYGELLRQIAQDLF